MNVTIVCDNCGVCTFRDFVTKEISFVSHEGKEVTKLKMECRNCKVPYIVVIKKDSDQPVGAGKHIDMEAEAIIATGNARTEGNFVTRYTDRNPVR